MSDAPKNWRDLNRANWDERVAVHLKPTGYDLTALRAGRGALNPVDEAEIGDVKGLRVLHLQCHFGADTLSLAQRGASVVGLDFSGAAIAAARDLASELGPADRARFVEADLYDAPAAIAEPASFDLVHSSWRPTRWLPDIRRWAEIVAQFLKPGGRFYYADAHPASYVFDDDARLADGRPGYFAPYFGRQPLVLFEHKDYADPTAHLANATNVEWRHPRTHLGRLIDAGLVLDWLHDTPRCPGACSRCWCRRTSATGTGRTSSGCRSPSRCRRGEGVCRAPVVGGASRPARAATGRQRPAAASPASGRPGTGIRRCRRPPGSAPRSSRRWTPPRRRAARPAAPAAARPAASARRRGAPCTTARARSRRPGWRPKAWSPDGRRTRRRAMARARSSSRPSSRAPRRPAG